MGDGPALTQTLNPINVFKALTDKDTQKKALADMAKEEAPFAIIAGAAGIVNPIIENGLKYGLGVPGTALSVFGPPAIEGAYRSFRRADLKVETWNQMRHKEFDEDIEFDVDNLAAYLGRVKNLFPGGKFNILDPKDRAKVFEIKKMVVPFSDIFVVDPATGRVSMKAPLGVALKNDMETAGEKQMDVFRAWFDDFWNKTLGPDGIAMLKNPENKAAQKVMLDVYNIAFESCYKRFQDGARLNMSVRSHEGEIRPVGTSGKVKSEIRDSIHEMDSIHKLNAGKVEIPFGDLFDITGGAVTMKAPLGIALKARIDASADPGREFENWFRSFWTAKLGPAGMSLLASSAALQEIYKIALDESYGKYTAGVDLVNTPGGAIPPDLLHTYETDLSKADILFLRVGGVDVKLNFQRPFDVYGDPNYRIAAMRAVPANPGPPPTAAIGAKHSRDVFDAWMYAQLDDQGVSVPSPLDGDSYAEWMTAYEEVYKQFMKIIDPLGQIAANEPPAGFSHTKLDRATSAFSNLLGREAFPVEGKHFKRLQLLMGDYQFVTTEEELKQYEDALVYLTDLARPWGPPATYKNWVEIDKDAREWIRNVVVYYKRQLAANTVAIGALGPGSPYNDPPGRLAALIADADSIIIAIHGAETNPAIQPLLEGGHLTDYDPMTGVLDEVPIEARIRGFAAGTDPLHSSENGTRSPDLQAVADAFGQPIMRDGSGLAGGVKGAAVDLLAAPAKAFERLTGLGRANLHYIAPTYLDGKATVEIPLNRGPRVVIDFGRYFKNEYGETKFVDSVPAALPPPAPQPPATTLMKDVLGKMGEFKGEKYARKKLSHDILRDELLISWQHAYAEANIYLPAGFPRPGQVNYEEFWEAFHWFYYNMMTVIDPEGKIAEAEQDFLNGHVEGAAKSAKQEIPLIANIGLPKPASERLSKFAKVFENRTQVRTGLGFQPTERLDFKQPMSVATDLTRLQSTYTELSTDITTAIATYEAQIMDLVTRNALPAANMPSTQVQERINDALKKLKSMKEALEKAYRDMYVEGLRGVFRYNFDAQNGRKTNDTKALKLKFKLTDEEIGIIKKYQETFPPGAFLDTKKDVPARKVDIQQVYDLMNKLDALPEVKASFLQVLSVGDGDFATAFGQILTDEHTHIHDPANPDDRPDGVDLQAEKLEIKINAVPGAAVIFPNYVALKAQIDGIDALLSAVPRDLVAINAAQAEIKRLHRLLQGEYPRVRLDRIPEEYKKLSEYYEDIVPWGGVVMVDLQRRMGEPHDPDVEEKDRRKGELEVKIMQLSKDGEERMVTEAFGRLSSVLGAPVLANVDAAVPAAPNTHAEYVTYATDLEAALSGIRLQDITDPVLRRDLIEKVKTKVSEMIVAEMTRVFTPPVDQLTLATNVEQAIVAIYPVIDLGNYYTTAELEAKIKEVRGDRAVRTLFTNAQAAVGAQPALVQYQTGIALRQQLMPVADYDGMEAYTDIVDAEFKRKFQTLETRVRDQALLELGAIPAVQAVGGPVPHDLLDAWVAQYTPMQFVMKDSAVSSAYAIKLAQLGPRP